MTDRDKYLAARNDLIKVKKLQRKVRTLTERNEAMIYSLTGGGIDYSKDRVQTSPSNMMESVMSQVLDNDVKIRKLNRKIHDITNSIYKLNNAKYTKVLLEVYVEGKTFSIIAEENNYKYKSNVEYLCKRALVSYYDLYHNI